MTQNALTQGDRLPLAEVVAALQAGLGERLISIVLFGSRARGDAHADSDWDLLVIARDLPQKTLARHLWLKNMLPVSWRGAVAVIAKTPEEFTARLPSLYLDIALDGLILYDATGYAAQRVSQVRRLIEKQGLYRESHHNDMQWHWRHFPGRTWSLEWEVSP